MKFIDRLWDDNKEFIVNVIGHGVKILLTMAVMKIIYLTSDLLFSEKPKIMKYMEDLSAWGLLAIFFILVLFDTIDIIKTRKQKIRRNDV